MSNVNVKRLVENIRSGTNIYTPLVELVVNAEQDILQQAWYRLSGPGGWSL